MAPTGRAEALEDRQEASRSAVRQAFDDVSEQADLGRRDDELVLEESSTTVEAVPVGDRIEWVEEGGGRLDGLVGRAALDATTGC